MTQYFYQRHNLKIPGSIYIRWNQVTILGKNNAQCGYRESHAYIVKNPGLGIYFLGSYYKIYIIWRYGELEFCKYIDKSNL